MVRNSRPSWLLEPLEDRAAPAFVQSVNTAAERALDFTCSFFDALTPFVRQPTLALPISQPTIFVNDFLIDLAPGYGNHCVALRPPAAILPWLAAA